MLETSKDILWLALAGSIALFTIFVCWALFYMIVMLRNMSKITVSVREKLELVDKILKLVKDKLEKGSNHIALISDSVIKLVGFLMEKKAESKGSRKKKNN
ncbi:hypothetical protein HYZ76_00375 [Candidatus Falkowbacteria bacterium]|nr:hypothetical protein [Candidatus Falkowbacteria bacterium]